MATTVQNPRLLHQGSHHKPPDLKAQVQEIVQRLERKPTMNDLEMLLSRVGLAGIPRNEWDGSMVLSFFLLLYREEIGIPHPRMSQEDIREAQNLFEAMVEEVGGELACDCVSVFFSDAMKWTSSKSPSFFTKRNINKYLLQAVGVQRLRARGTQSNEGRLGEFWEARKKFRKTHAADLVFPFWRKDMQKKSHSDFDSEYNPGRDLTDYSMGQ